MSVSYDSYKVFYYVAYYKNITIAAKSLFLTQPTVSHYILNLEKELNCKLFIRSKKGMQLSPEGELLFEHVAKAYAEISYGEEKLKEYLNLGKGIIKIGASETTMRNYLIPVLGHFKEKYPNIQLRICNTTYKLVNEALKDGSLDLAVMTTPFPHNELEIHPVADFSMVGITGPAFSYLEGKPLELHEISRYPLITLEQETSGRFYLDRLFSNQGIHLKPDIEVSSADLITPLAEQNMGIGFVPKIFAEQALLSKKIIELTFKQSFPNRSICILTDPHRQKSLACQKFISEILGTLS